MKILSTLLFALILCAGTAHAEPQKKEPLVVTADKSLEWHQTAKKYIARVNAIAKQGTAELHGDTLTASYTDGGGQEKSGISISRIDAVGNVLVMSDGSRATGDQGFYDLKTGYSELTGGNLKLETKTDTITARDKITYDSKKNQMSAIGNAKAVREKDTITADTLTGYFQKDEKTGQTKLKNMQADGSVVIVTPDDTLYGDHGTYNADTNIATITGRVRIERGENVITGSRGEVDLNTNISRIFGGGGTVTPKPAKPAASGTLVNRTPGINNNTDNTDTTGSDGRVRGVFYPE